MIRKKFSKEMINIFNETNKIANSKEPIKEYNFETKFVPENSQIESELLNYLDSEKSEIDEYLIDFMAEIIYGITSGAKNIDDMPDLETISSILLFSIKKKGFKISK